jgi:hypothetical protein
MDRNDYLISRSAPFLNAAKVRNVGGVGGWILDWLGTHITPGRAGGCGACLHVRRVGSSAPGFAGGWGAGSRSRPCLADLFFVDVDFEESREFLEIAFGFDVADHRDQRFGVDQVFKWDVVQLQLAGDGDHYAVEAFFD